MRIDIDRGTVEYVAKICRREASKVVYRKLEQFIVRETHSGSYYQMQIEPDLMGGFPVDSFLLFRCKSLYPLKFAPVGER